MRILLVKPKARLPAVLGLQAFTMLEPLELGYLAAVVPEHSVRVIDLRLYRAAGRALRNACECFRPDLVGFTGYTHEGSIIKELALTVRRLLPRTRIVVGGHHATVAPHDYNLPQIDFIVRGEGCEPFRALVQALDRGGEVLGIPNLLLSGDGYDESAATGWPQFPDPESLPVPRRDLWDASSYYSVWAAEEHPRWQTIFPRVAMVRTSFGCRMKCSFCIVPLLCGGVHRTRPVASVADEIASLPADHIYFSDDENFIDEGFAFQLAEALEQRGVRKRYFAWTRATTVNRSPELLRRWRQIGLDAAFLGFEFPSDEELKKATKGGTVAGNERALETLRSIGICVHAAFMVRPEYGQEEFGRLREYVRSLPPSQSSFTVCTPSPGTPDYQAMQADIWIANPFDLHDCMHPLTPTRLPLPEFARLFAEQAAEGTSQTPLRVKRQPIPPKDIWRVWRADRRYYRGFRRLYRDFPRHLWS